MYVCMKNRCFTGKGEGKKKGRENSGRLKTVNVVLPCGLLFNNINKIALVL